MAELFSSAGYPTNHESFYGMPGYGTFRQYAVGEASWLAMPFLDRDGDRPKLHIVRDPLKVVSSLVDDEFFSKKSWKINPYTQFVHLFLPKVKKYKGLDQYLYFWTEWNNQITHRIPMNRWRIEDVNKNPKKLFEDLGLKIKPDAKLFDDTKCNTKGIKKYMTLKDLDKCELKDEFVDCAGYFGYDLK
jgi:hypothetical protein